MKIKILLKMKKEIVITYFCVFSFFLIFMYFCLRNDEKLHSIRIFFLLFLLLSGKRD